MSAPWTCWLLLGVALLAPWQTLSQAQSGVPASAGHDDCCCAGDGCGSAGTGAGTDGCCSGKAAGGPSLVAGCGCGAPAPDSAALAHGVRLDLPRSSAPAALAPVAGARLRLPPGRAPGSHSDRPEPPVPRRAA